MRSFLIVAAVTQLLIGSAFAQDRPLFQQFRIGYPLNGSIGDDLKPSNTLDRELRRIGLIASWHPFDDGLSALRALHAEDIDVALDIAQHEVILAKLEDLSMVFVAERKPRDDREAEQTSPDDTVRRYTLTSEYFADQREDALSLIFSALRIAARSGAAIQLGRKYDVSFVTRPLLAARQQLADASLVESHIPRKVDFADVNYWMPLDNRRAQADGWASEVR